MKLRHLPFLLLIILVSLSCCKSRQKASESVMASPVGGEVRIESPPAPPASETRYPVPPSSARFSGNMTPAKMPSQRTSFEQELNPTGEPIGGGVGYSKYIRQQDARFVVRDKAGLISALREADSLDIIYIPGDVVMNLTGEQLTLPGGVTLASDRGLAGSPGALLYSNTMYGQKEVDSWHDHLFITGGKYVHVTGLRLKGPSGEVFEHDKMVACGVKGMHGFLEVSNCELSNWLKWAVDLAYARGDHIHHNHIHHTRRNGYGYGVWVRGVLKHPVPGYDEISLIEANLIEACRHEIAAGGMRTSSYIARYNIIDLHSMNNHNVDRHRQGYYTEVRNNVLASSNHFVFHGMEMPPLDRIIFEGNWCDPDDMDRVFPKRTKPEAQGKVRARNNHLGGSWRENQPVASIRAGTLSGTAPLTVDFSASGTDPKGYSVDAFIWDWKDGKDFYQTPYPQMRLRFDEPGVYHVRVRCRNSYGLVSEPVGVKVHVTAPGRPTDGLYGKLIAFWEFDDKDDPLRDATGRYPLMYDNGVPRRVEGMVGGALQRTGSFNEATQMLSIPNRNAGAFQPGNNDFSFMVCFRVDEHPDITSYSGILGYAAGNAWHPGYNVVMRKSEPMQLLFYMAEGRAPNSREELGTAEKGKWIVLVCSVDRDGRTRSWIDGREGAGFDSPHPGSHIYHEHANYGIFQRFAAYPHASVDFAAVWDRALSPAEAEWLSNGGNGRTYEGLKAYKP